MVRFLSPEWLERVAEALRDKDEVRQATRGLRFTLRQVVTGGPEGDVVYRMEIVDGAVHVLPGPGEAAGGGPGGADVALIEDYETAVAVSRGEITPAEAFATGRLKVDGQVALLVDHQEVFARLGSLLEPVRAETEYV